MSKSRDRFDSELGEHVKKAVSPVETAPKQKHVRACIMYAYDFKTSTPFWNNLKLQPVLADEVQCFKALIVIHKMLVGGPHCVIKEAMSQRNFLDNCIKSQGQSNLGHGYGPLIKDYVYYLIAKLEFHKSHPEFNGNFDYEEYLTLKGISDLNDGYQTIIELIDLSGRLDSFQKTVFSQFRPSASNECRIASLVPLIEESYGIWKFLTSMLTGMFLCVEADDPLLPLVEQYNVNFKRLQAFYDECRKLSYLTSLITIPQLPNEPPKFSVEMSSNPNRGNESSVLVEGSSEDILRPVLMPNVNEEIVQQANESLMDLGLKLQEALENNHLHEETITELQKKVSVLDATNIALEKELQTSKRDNSAEVVKWKTKHDELMHFYQKLRREHLQLLSKESVGSDEIMERLRQLEEQQDLYKSELLSKENQIAELEDKISLLELKSSEQSEQNIFNDPQSALDGIISQLTRAMDSLKSVSKDQQYQYGALNLSMELCELLQAAINLQNEIVSEGKGSGSPESFYKKNSVWTEGLISSAQAVADATIRLIDTARKVDDGHAVPEEVIVSGTQMSASVAQLITASRVKARQDSSHLTALEAASAKVYSANRSITKTARSGSSDYDYNQEIELSGNDRKIKEMEYQVSILQKEKEIESLRKAVTSIRKSEYQ